MSETVITVENLSKSYLVGHKSVDQVRHGDTFREVLGREARNFVRNAVDIVCGRQIVSGDQAEEFWALKDVSFEVKQGEVIGIIGRNGAGKSTLLKILSRITEPTKGRVILGGRVASLLEVGTGFHPELTGRENVFLNGAILGMTRREIARKFDEIVAFAEVEKFLDTPVKRYSSGMYVRLAFAVAAHLEPEILIVDEVLAVGDAAFQQKCLGKMDQAARQSRTVLFVSHNMAAVRTLTQKCILLEQGAIAGLGDTRDILADYLTRAYETGNRAAGSHDLDSFRRFKNDTSQVRIIGIGVNGSYRGPDGGVPNIHLGTGITIDVRFAVTGNLNGGEVGMILKTFEGEHVAVLNSFDNNFQLFLEPGYSTLRVKIGDLPLAPGRYCLDVGVDCGQIGYEHIVDYPLLSIVNKGQVTHWLHRPWGLLHCQAVEWSTSLEESGSDPGLHIGACGLPATPSGTNPTFGAHP